MIVHRSQNAVLPRMNLLRLKGLPVLQQLQIEERLLRTSTENWCIINDGTPLPTIVMGISGKAAELVEIQSVLHDKVPVIRRFTGGGTVLVDRGTIFVTFICGKNALPDLQPYPRPIMFWSSVLYNRVFHGMGDFHLRENGKEILGFASVHECEKEGPCEGVSVWLNSDVCSKVCQVLS